MRTSILGTLLLFSAACTPPTEQAAAMGDDYSSDDKADNFAAAAPVPAHLSLPNPSLTPGAVLTTDVNVIAQPGYASTIRHVPASEKTAVAKEYNYTGPSSAVEFDHLVSLELGGSNDITNLWPQPIAEAHVKDRLEDYLYRKVIDGEMSLPDVQARIAADWVKLWKDVGRP